MNCSIKGAAGRYCLTRGGNPVPLLVESAKKQKKYPTAQCFNTMYSRDLTHRYEHTYNPL